MDCLDSGCIRMSGTKKLKYEEIIALVSYCFSSLTITLLNKAVLSSGQFGMNFLLLAVQALSSIALLAIFKSTGSIDFKPLRKSESIQCKSNSLHFNSIHFCRVTGEFVIDCHDIHWQ